MIIKQISFELRKKSSGFVEKILEKVIRFFFSWDGQNNGFDYKK
jgi:hypothetical protein